MNEIATRYKNQQINTHFLFTSEIQIYAYIYLKINIFTCKENHIGTSILCTKPSLFTSADFDEKPRTQFRYDFPVREKGVGMLLSSRLCNQNTYFRCFAMLYSLHATGSILFSCSLALLILHYNVICFSCDSIQYDMQDCDMSTLHTV